MKIDTSDWKWFSVGGENGLFKLENCKCSNASELTDGTDIFYIGAKKSNNGIMRRVACDPRLITRGNCIVFICDGQGSVGYTNYMEHDFIGSTTLSVGYNPQLNKNIGLFLVCLLDRERPKYSFGRKYRRTLADTQIKLPVKGDGTPDWEYMDAFIQSLRSKPIRTDICSSGEFPDTSLWKNYRMDELFDIKKGKRLTKASIVPGNVNFLGAISENNGVREKIEVDDPMEPNCISVNYNGSVGEAFFQSEPFWASDDVNLLYAKSYWKMNKYIAMFLITVIKANRYRFSYGRKWTTDKMKETILRLPADPDGRPDFNRMEKYIRTLPFSDRI